MSPGVKSAFRRSPALPRGFVLEGALERKLYLLPAGMVAGEQAAAAVLSGNGWPICDGALAFTSVSVILRDPKGCFAALTPFHELVDWAESQGEEVARHVSRLVQRIGKARPPFAGLAMDRPRVMAIVNVTPDSFSDGGDTYDHDAAVAAGLAMAEAGADIIDVGGESTRPGSEPVAEDEELARVLPVVRALAEKGLCVSIDTHHARVMGAAVEAGARIINDVTALAGPGSLEVAARSGAAVVLMHMLGDDPKTMQDDPRYECVPLDVHDHLAERLAACEAAGIPRGKLCVDPGIGFGKTAEHNAQLFSSLALFHGLGVPVLLACSRKTFVARLSAGEGPKQRLPGTLAAELAGLDAGAHMLRVHDVVETVQAIKVWQAIRAGA